MTTEERDIFFKAMVSFSKGFGKRNHCLKENVAKCCFKFSKNYRSYKKLAISNNRKSFLSDTHSQKNSCKVETPYEFLV